MHDNIRSFVHHAVSHSNFSFLMIIVIQVVYLVPLVDSLVISHKRIMKLPVGLIWLF